MLNVIWGFFLIGGILTGAFLGRMDLVTNAVIDGGRNAVELAFTMAGVVAVWSGILKIAEKGGMIDALAKKMEPFLDFLFPEVPRGHAARRYISANFAANFLGLGWAATPAGLLAMEELAKLNGKTGRASNAMCMFLVVNMSSLQLVTVNILAYRAEYGSVAPAETMGQALLPRWVLPLWGFCWRRYWKGGENIAVSDGAFGLHHSRDGTVYCGFRFPQAGESL